MPTPSYTTHSAATAITALYEEVVDRMPDAQGLAAWTSALIGGERLNDIRYACAMSAEVKTRLTLAYRAVFQATIPAAQLLAAQTAIIDGATLAQVLAPWQSIADAEITNLYENDLGRTPDPTGLLSYSTAMTMGIPLASIQVTFAFSPSAANALSLAYTKAFGAPITSSQQLADQYLLSVGYNIATVTDVQMMTVQETVISIYEDSLNRAPTASELVNKSFALLRGATRASLETTLANSNEASTDLNSAYLNDFNVSPTVSQVSSAQSAIAAGSTLEDVETAWSTASTEELYKEVLGRAADPGGLAGFVAAMVQGTDYSRVRYLLATGPEATADLQNAYSGAYNVLLTPNQLSSAELQLANGQTLAEVEAPWISVAQTEITTLYENILGREPDSGGLASYTKALVTGTSLQSIRNLFSNSAEAAGQLSQAYENATSSPITTNQLLQAETELAAGQSLQQVEAQWFTFVPGSTASPQIWFAAVDPYVASVSGSTTTSDYMNLFGSYLGWNTEAQVFKISTQFALWGSAQQLKTLFSYLNANNIALAVEGLMLPMTPGSTAGQGVEGFNGPPGSMGVVAQRIASLGGHLQYIAMDEPLYFGHQYSGTNGPQESIEEVAQQVAVNVAAVERVFPNVEVGDIEPVPGTNDLKTWAADYESAVGKPLSFFDADVSWTNGPYLGALEQVAGQFRQMGITFGVGINGNGQHVTDSKWVTTAEQRLASIETDPLIRPEQVIVQTWGPNPSEAGPKGTAGSLTNLLGNVANATTFYNSENLGLQQPVTIPLTGPTSIAAIAGNASSIPGLSLVTPSVSTVPVNVGVVLLTDTGDLSTLTTNGVQVYGNGTSALSLFGSIQTVQSELANLSYQDFLVGTDHLSITVYVGTQAPISYEATITVASSSGSLPHDISSSSAVLSSPTSGHELLGAGL